MFLSISAGRPTTPSTTLYRVYFDTPITAESIFYIAGSYYNNYFTTGEWIHEPTAYVGMGRWWTRWDPYVSAPRYHDKILRASDEKGPWRNSGIYNFYYGPFFAIAPDTSCVLDVHTTDSAMGSVQGGGWYLDSSYITITAVAQRGYRFAHWNDGDVTNPRTILLTHNTTFTAYFEEAYYTLAATAEPEGSGTVRGAGHTVATTPPRWQPCPTKATPSSDGATATRHRPDSWR